jgi:hypothetical protein
LAHRLRLEEAIAAWRLPVDVWAVDGLQLEGVTHAR